MQHASSYTQTTFPICKWNLASPLSMGVDHVDSHHELEPYVQRQEVAEVSVRHNLRSHAQMPLGILHRICRHKMAECLRVWHQPSLVANCMNVRGRSDCSGPGQGRGHGLATRQDEPFARCRYCTATDCWLLVQLC